MIYNSVIFVAMAVGMAVNANPLNISPRAKNGGYSPIALCMQKNGFPDYPEGPPPSYKAVDECIPRKQHRVKREDRILANSEPPKGNSTLERRKLECSNPLWCNTLAGWLSVPPAQDEDCVDDIPNKFIEASALIANATSFCETFQGMAGNIHKDGIARTITTHVTNGYNKQGHVFDTGVHVTVTFFLKVNPLLGMAADTAESVADVIYKVCPDAIRLLADKEKGCAKNIKGIMSVWDIFNTKTLKAARSGFLPLMLEDHTEIGYLGADFNPTKK